MKIANILAQPDYTLKITTTEGLVGVFDVAPYLTLEAFEPLQNLNNFMHVLNGGYFIEWDCGADLSADTVEAKWVVVKSHMPASNAGFK
ncbi:MAG: DUF2442 domain-containing protein [Anaerolineales bacterium]|nr:DUF2442 domain-containing protein [Anaerolineales bacterium]